MLNNLKLFLIFIKYKLFFVSFKSETNFKINILNKVMPNLFHHFYFNKFQTLNSGRMGFYANNLNKSFIYWAYKITYLFITKGKNQIKTTIHFEKNNFLNQYFSPVIVSNLPLNLNKFKNFFYFNFFLLSFLWFGCSAKVKFIQNFLFLIEDLMLSPMFSGYFFKIYKF